MKLVGAKREGNIGPLKDAFLVNLNRDLLNHAILILVVSFELLSLASHDRTLISAEWGDWKDGSSVCTVSCDGGKIERSRDCIFQNTPIENSKCPGNDTHFFDCNQQKCRKSSFCHMKKEVYQNFHRIEILYISILVPR